MLEGAEARSRLPIGGSSLSPSLSGEGNPLTIRLNASNSQGGAAVAQAIASTFKGKRIAFLTENDAYGVGTQEAIEAELKRLGHDYKKVAEEKFPFTQADFRIPLTNVRAAEPDVTVAINANEGLGMPSIIRQFKQGRVPGPRAYVGFPAAGTGCAHVQALVASAGSPGANDPASRSPTGLGRRIVELSRMLCSFVMRSQA